MSETRNVLQASTRESGNKGVARRVRQEGLIPGVIYGAGLDNVVVAVDPKAFELMLRTEYGYNAVFNVEVEGGQSYQVMVREIQFDSVRRVATHIDFKVVKDEDRIFLDIPVVTTGAARGVKEGGRLQIVRRTVKVVTTVAQIPASISHDVTSMRIGDQVYVDELVVPEGTEAVFNHRYPVITVARRRGKAAAVALAAAPVIDDEDEDEEDGEA